MSPESLSDMLHAQLFRPFRIRLATGRQLDVRHPDFLSRSPGGRTAVVWKSEESFEVIDLLLVASLEILNGKGQ